METTLPPQAKNLLDPIMRAPPEIASEIFVMCLPDRSDVHPGKLDAASRAPLLLLSICKYWTGVALSNPALWTDLVFHVRGYDYSSDGRPYRTWIARYATQKANPVPERHLSCDLDIPLTMSGLHVPDLVVRLAHHLQTVHFEDRSIYGRSKKHRVEEYLRIFRFALNIAECAFSCLFFEVEDPECKTPNDRRITLPSLKSLQMKRDVSNALFLPFLTLPGLQKLEIPCSAAHAPGLVSLLARSSPPLVSLTLRTGDTPWPRPTIEGCLHLLPTLSNLTLRGSEDLFQDDFIAILSEAPFNNFLPNLSHFEIYVEDSLPPQPWFQ
ncbi:hypothetical protein B0H13DRAFT_2670436 [Mycena leptocephala]|nr:hypothetical protein B0H13DRAFT_2670436 [Mycena leptocephala]